MLSLRRSIGVISQGVGKGAKEPCRRHVGGFLVVKDGLRNKWMLYFLFVVTISVFAEILKLLKVFS